MLFNKTHDSPQDAHDVRIFIINAVGFFVNDFLLCCLSNVLRLTEKPEAAGTNYVSECFFTICLD